MNRIQEWNFWAERRHAEADNTSRACPRRSKGLHILQYIGVGSRFHLYITE